MVKLSSILYIILLLFIVGCKKQSDTDLFLSYASGIITATITKQTLVVTAIITIKLAIYFNGEIKDFIYDLINVTRPYYIEIYNDIKLIINTKSILKD